MVSERLPRKLAAILYADVAGYSRLTGDDEDATHRQLSQHLDLISRTVEEHRGRVMHYAGDAVLAMFDAVVDALSCAAHVQRDLGARNAPLPDERRVQFRIGLNLGDVIEDRGDIYGDGVNVAARLESLAQPGGICISGSIHDAIGSKLPLDYEFLGEQQVKNIERPVRAYHARLRAGVALPALAASSARPKRSRVSLAVIAIVAVLAVAGGLLAWRGPLSGWLESPPAADSATHSSDKPSLAVLPFLNVSDDARQEYFADGLTDDLITDLSKISGLFVIARNSVFTFKNQAVLIKDVARQLGVRYVLEGSVRRAGDRVRVNAQLIDGSTGHHVWAERYDRKITDLFSVQDEFVSQIVAALAVELTASEAVQLEHRPAPDFRAYELYLQARDGYFSGDDARMREALSLFEEAWAIDPSFAKAYSGYARAAADVWRLRSTRVMTAPLARQAAEDAAKQALALDPNLPDAHSVLALLAMVAGDHDASVASARRAASLDPNSAEAQTVLSVVLAYAGQPKSALEAIRTAVRLDPRPPSTVWTYYALALFLNQRYDKAIEVLEPIAGTTEQSLNDNPREILAMAYAQAGRPDEAWAQMQALREPEPFLNLAYLRLRYAHHAREEDLEHRLDALRKAGMPEWPLDFRGDPKHRVRGPEVRILVDGKVWTGTDAARGPLPFIQEFRDDGGTVFASRTAIMSGTAFVEGDELCERFDIITFGRSACGSVYRTPHGTAQARNEYVFVNPITVRYFSLK